MTTPTLRALFRAAGLLLLLLLAFVPGYRRQQGRDSWRLGPLPGAWTPGLGTSLLNRATEAMEGTPVRGVPYKRVCTSGWDWDPVARLEWLSAHGSTQVFLEDRVLFLVRPSFGTYGGFSLDSFMIYLHERIVSWLGRRVAPPEGRPRSFPAVTARSSNALFHEPSRALVAQLRRMARAGVRIVLLPMPLAPSNPPWDPGVRARRDQVLTTLRSEGTVEIWTCPASFLAGDFIDDAHLAASGSRLYSTWLLGRMARSEP